MEVRVLRYFLAVAQEESISGAAAFLNVTQPTLSRQLMDLEEELGTQLFMRSNRKITLTEDGMLLRKRAQEIVALVEKTEAEFHAADDLISGDIYIGGGETEVMHLIGKVAQKLQKENAQIRYHLFSGNADDVTERLDKGLLDFGILIGPANIKKYDFLLLPEVDVWGILMRKDSPLAQLEKIRPQDIWNVPLLCSSQTMVSNQISGWLKKDFAQLNVVATYNLIYNASLLVEEGLGYALCLDKLANTSETSPLCFRPLEPKLETNLNIIWKKYQIFSKPAELFLKNLQQLLQA